jgi:superfamily I DNA/RNA helicase
MTAFGQQLKPTEEQVDIVDAVRSGSDVVIEAGAGTGKSTTLKIVGRDAAERGQHGMVIYFNRAPADEARRTMPPNVSASTAHSLAFHAMKDDPVMERFDRNAPPVTARYLAEDVFQIRKWFQVPKRKAISTWKIASLAVQTVRRFCYSDAEEVQPWHVPRVEGVVGDLERELRDVVLPYARRIWSDLQQPSGFARFEDDHYMKLWALGDPKLEADFLFVDESQDTNGVLAGVVRRQTHLQRVLVGDSQQRLFSWRGTVDLMREFEHAEVRYLTQSFRFGQAVAEEANRWLEYLEAPLRLRGLPSINSRLGYLEQPDAVLCRTNADVIEQAMEAQLRGFDVAVVGGTDEIASFATAVDELRTNGKTRHPSLSIFKNWVDVQAYVREEEPGGNFATAVRLIELYGTDRIRDVAARCVSPASADYVVSTVHKVKGMEWPSVLLDPHLMPDEALGQPGVGRSEYMVSYVAATRAKEALDATAFEPFHRLRAQRREATRVS